MGKTIGIWAIAILSLAVAQRAPAGTIEEEAVGAWRPFMDADAPRRFGGEAKTGLFDWLRRPDRRGAAPAPEPDPTGINRLLSAVRSFLPEGTYFGATSDFPGGKCAVVVRHVDPTLFVLTVTTPELAGERFPQIRYPSLALSVSWETANPRHYASSKVRKLEVDATRLSAMTYISEGGLAPGGAQALEAARGPDGRLESVAIESFSYWGGSDHHKTASCRL